jgi:membrane-bound serine protease (ClpP class)
VKRVAVLPIQGDIEPGLVYVVRRGVKEAMDRGADALILQMDTNGGRVDSTEEIIQILRKFPHQDRTITLVDTKAFSAGAFISAATRRIYMVPGGVIGAATPILATGQEMPKSLEEKLQSGIRGLVRASAEQHGHNTAVFEAMIDRDQGLTVDGREIVPKGKILTLTAKEAEQLYGKPPRTLLSAGTVESLDALLGQLGWAYTEKITIQETGFEKIARWIVKIGPILLLAGIVGVYVEFKTPGFGVPGIAGAFCLLLFFFGHYIAGLSGMEAMLLFILGVVLVATELFLIPGLVLPGVAGALLILMSMVLAMADQYPTDPVIPSIAQLQLPMLKVSSALAGAIVLVGVLARVLPETPVRGLVLKTVSGQDVEGKPFLLGREGEAVTSLRPAGKAKFGDALEDVVTVGDFLAAGTKVRVVEVEGARLVVERV